MAVESVSLSSLLGAHGVAAQTGFDAPASADAEAGDSAVPDWAVAEILAAGERMDRQGLVPATAGNLSLRLEDGSIAITRSGCHKGMLSGADVLRVDRDGAVIGAASGAGSGEARASAETRLHCQIYGADRTAGAVLHGHSVAATVLSRVAGEAILLEGYEVLKAFAGIRTHASRIAVPVIENEQDMARMEERVAPHLQAGLAAGYLIRGHGAYAWGADMATAMARLEALEFLLACELAARSLR